MTSWCHVVLVDRNCILRCSALGTKYKASQIQLWPSETNLPSFINWHTPSSQMPSIKVRSKAVPPPQILPLRPIEAHLKPPQHRRKRDIQLTPCKVNTQAASRPLAKGHKPLLKPLRIVTKPSVRDKIFWICKNGAGPVDKNTRHSYNRTTGN